MLLENLKNEENRTASFVCALACAFPDGREPIEVQGSVTGEILREARGENGFGYDPLFYYPPFGKTTAEMSEAEKNTISHRGAAVRRFALLFAAQMDK